MGDVHVVAVVSSPLQALNLVEYCWRFDRVVDLVVVGCETAALEPASRLQIDSVLGLISPHAVIFRNWHIRLSEPFGAKKTVAAEADAIRALVNGVDYEFVVGEYRSAFCWAVLHRLGSLASTVVVVDDGTATLRMDRRRSLRSSKVRRQMLKSLVHLAIGIPGVIPSSGITFFSAYPLDARIADGDVVVPNDYRSLRQKLSCLPVDEEHVFVIGGPYLENGEVDAGDVELALDLARFAAEHTGKEVIYVAHRRERAEKLDDLRRTIKVVTPTVPFELYPLVHGKRTQVLVGYYSSLFVTAAKLYGSSIQIIALQIPRSRINASVLPFVDTVYQYYRTELPTVVEIAESSATPRGA